MHNTREPGSHPTYLAATLAEDRASAPLPAGVRQGHDLVLPSHYMPIPGISSPPGIVCVSSHPSSVGSSIPKIIAT